jgi:integrase
MVAAFAGLRQGEIEGLKWSDFTGAELHVQRNISAGRTVQTTKTESSTAAVPVIPMLRNALEEHKLRRSAVQVFGQTRFTKVNNDGWIFAGGRCGRPAQLRNIARRVIIPTLANAGLQWRGWHAFRRGVASNLHVLGVPDLTIQKIMRHSDLRTTVACYIKTRDEQTMIAMQRLEQAFNGGATVQ